MTQASVTIFGIPDSVLTDASSASVNISFAGLVVRVSAQMAQALDKGNPDGSMKIEAELRGGRWIASQVIAISKEMAAKNENLSQPSPYSQPQDKPPQSSQAGANHQPPTLQAVPSRAPAPGQRSTQQPRPGNPFSNLSSKRLELATPPKQSAQPASPPAAQAASPAKAAPYRLPDDAPKDEPKPAISKLSSYDDFEDIPF
jgi:hypothetical protein